MVMPRSTKKSAKQSKRTPIKTVSKTKSKVIESLQQGIALHQQGQLEQARLIYEKILSKEPRQFDALHLLGVINYQFNQHLKALKLLDKAIEINPYDASAFSNRGIILNALQRPDEALIDYDEAIKINPDHANAHSNRGLALRALNYFDEALTSYNRAIDISPNNADAYLYKSLVLLLLGQFHQGWQLYEWRWEGESTALTRRQYAQPLWLGQESLVGKTILLHEEQGFGDTIQFCRYAKLVQALGARVVLEAPNALKDLLESLDGVDELVTKGQTLPSFDYYCPLMSLPLAFKTDLTSIPSPSPYLFPSPGKSLRWEQRLGVKVKPRIGLVWSGGSKHKLDKLRSLTLKQLLPHLSDEYEWVSLQKEVREVDKALLKDSDIRHYGESLKDFSDTAAICELMDLVISIDTSVAHLAGAMGKETWIMLPFSPDWRWLLDRDGSPWYESVRLYRQDVRGDWQPTLARVVADLDAKAQLNMKLRVPKTHIAPPTTANKRPSTQVQSDVANLVKQAIALHQQGQLSQAKAVYQQILAQQPNHFDALHLLGVINYQYNKPLQALELIDKAIEINPHDASALSNRGLVLKALTRFDEALVSYDKAIDIAPSYADAYCNRGAVLKALKRYDEAIISYDKAIEVLPTHASAYNNRGLALKELRRFDEAVTSYDAAIEIKPDYAECYCNRGAVFITLNRLNEAMDSFDKAIEISPNYAEAYSNRGVVLKKLNSLEQALINFDKAIEFKPDYAQAYVNRGNTGCQSRPSS